jgi:hypothetical protein
MGSSVVGADAGTAFSFWTQNAVKGGQILSTHISGGDLNYGNSPTQDSNLWARKLRITVDPAGGSIRWRGDIADATQTPAIFSGHVLTGGDTLELAGWENIKRFQFASTQITPGILNITAER